MIDAKLLMWYVSIHDMRAVGRFRLQALCFFVSYIYASFILW